MRWANVSFAAAGVALLLTGVNGAAVKSTSTVYVYEDCTTSYESATATTGASSGNHEVAVTSASGPQVTLLPAVHWDHNSSDINNLLPCDGATLYYAETSGYQSPNDKSQCAHVTTNFSTPSVILDGTIHIKDITCSALSSSHETNMRITFSSQQAYAFAESAWKSLKHLVLVTFHAGCGSASDTRIFWAVEVLDFGPGGCTCVEVKAVELEFADCVTDLDVEWGTYTPPPKTFPVGGSGSGGSRGGSGSSGHSGSSGSSGHNGSSGSGSSGSGSGSSGSGSSGSGSGSGSSGSGSSGSGSSGSGSSGSPGSGPFTNGTTSGTNSTGTYTNGTTSGTGSSGTGSSGTNTNGTSSGTAPTSNGGSCGVPPSSTIDGFPTAPCGDDFDQTLDDEIGYFDWDDSADDSSDESDFFPGYSGSDGSKKRALHMRRGFWDTLEGAASSLGSDIVNLGEKAGSAIGGAISTGVTALGEIKDAIVNGVTGSLEKDLTFDYIPGNLTDSPFGQAVEIYNVTKENKAGTLSGSLTVYCVDCEFKSNIDIVGKVTASLSGITAGSVGMTGNVHAGIGLGLDAQVEYKDTFIKQLVQETIPELTIPNVIAVGPIYTISAELDLDAKAEGQMLAGIAMDITNFAATLDLLDSSKSSSSGFTPTFTKTFTVSGEIDVSAILSIPIDIGVGITIPLIKWEKTIGLVEKPGINATASFTGSTDPDQLADMACPNGISWDVSLTNDVSLDFFGTPVDLFPYNSPPLLNGCYQLGGSSNGTQTSGGSSSPTQTSSDGSSDGPTGATPTPTSGGGSDSGGGSSDSTPTTVGGSGATPTPTDGSDGSDGSTDTTSTSTPTSGPSSGDGSSNGSGDSSDDDAENDFKDGSKYTYISIADNTKTYSLTADDDGNFYLDNFGESYSYYELFGSVTTTDDTERIFHFYNDTMTALGVSRFRLSYEDQIPKTAQIASLVAIDYDDSTSTLPVFIAADLVGNFYYTVACTIEDEYTKIFLVKDIEAGIAMLKKPELMYTVTGGVVTECSYMPFTPIPGAGSKMRV